MQQLAESVESTHQENGKPESTLITGNVTAERTYFDDLPAPGGRTFRLQSLTYGEMKAALKYDASHHFLAVVCMAVVDERGDTVFVPSEQQFHSFDKFPSELVEALVEGVKAFCLNSIDYEELAKNY